MEPIKKCTKCNLEKEVIEFNKRTKSSDGFDYICKLCDKIKNSKYRKNNLLKERNRVKQYKLNNIDKVKESNKLYRETNEIKVKEATKKWRENNLERDKTNKNNWFKNNPNYFKEYQRRYSKLNPHIIGWKRILTNCLSRLNKTKEEHTIDLLGYSALEFKNHIENLFTEGMSWDNYGEWHIDHIKPVCSFDKDTPMNEVNALSNLRPLWATTREINGIIYEGNLNRPKF